MTDTTPMAPDRSNPDRCLSVHWSLPVQCVLHVAHRENWHETRHPETGNRLRYRYGALATEELRSGQWHDLDIPRPDNRSREQLRAEVARLTAELAKYTGWEPTVREEYEHACGQLATVSKVVEQFAAGDQLAVNQFVADLKNALELS